MKTKMKFFSVLLSMTLLLSVLVLPLSIHAAEPDYTVTTLEELAEAAANDLTGKTVSIANNITVTSNTSIPSFNGTLEGNGNTISGLTAALFTTLSNATVQNLNLSGAIDNSVADNGLLARSATGNLTVTGCTVNVTIGKAASNGQVNVAQGGFVGMYGTTDFAVINGWEPHGCEDAGTAIFTDCTVTGSHEAQTTNRSYLGGILGFAEGTVTMLRCKNEMTSMKQSVTASTAANLKQHHMGGMLGYAIDATVTMTDCVNAASLEGTSYVAGFLAYVTTSTVTVTNGVNSAAVKGDVSAITDDVPTGIGGFVGYTSCSVSISNSTNTGAVSAAAKNRAFAGGFVGYGIAGSSVSISGAVNGGTVSAQSTGNDCSAGGLIGREHAAFTLSDSANIGAVTASSTGRGHAGGMVGVMSKDSTFDTITDCLNDGTITANRATGGIVGTFYKQNNGQVTRFVNTGTLSCTTKIYQAAFFGCYEWETTAQTLTLTDCFYNASKAEHGIGMNRAGDYNPLTLNVVNGTSSTSVLGTDYPGTDNVDEVRVAYDTATASCAVTGFAGLRAAHAMSSFMGDSWYMTEGAPIPAAIADRLLEKTEQTAAIRYKGLQYTEADGGMFSVRFVAVLDSLAYESVTYNVKKVEMGVKSVGELSKSDTVVYSALTGYDEEGTQTYNATEFGGTYFSAISFDQVPADKTVSFVITPVLEGMDGSADAEGMTFVAVFENGELVTQYQY